MKTSDFRGTKLFKLYLYLVSSAIRQSKGKVVISKQIAALTGVDSIADYNPKWLY